MLPPDHQAASQAVDHTVEEHTERTSVLSRLATLKDQHCILARERTVVESAGCRDGQTRLDGGFLEILVGV